jgi:hypothetical protein
MKVVLKPGTISSSTLKFSTTDSGYIQLSDMIVRKTTRDRGKALKLVSNQPGEVQQPPTEAKAQLNQKGIESDEALSDGWEKAKRDD